MKATPGPWHAEEYEIKSEDYGGIAYCYNEPAEIEEVLEIARANARLIAAAPEMLEALKSIENDDNSIPDSIWKMIKNAISKAEGK